MDLAAELEAMVLNVSDVVMEDTISDSDAERWQRLFGFTRAEAIRRLEDYRNDHSRKRIPDALWAAVCSRREVEGYDREAFEYSLTQHTKPLNHGPPRAGNARLYLVQLSSPIDTPEKIQFAAGLEQAPGSFTGTGHCGEVEFCYIDAGAKAQLLTWIAEHHPWFHPRIVALGSMAKKDPGAPPLGPMKLDGE